MGKKVRYHEDLYRYRTVCELQGSPKPFQVHAGHKGGKQKPYWPTGCPVNDGYEWENDRTIIPCIISNLMQSPNLAIWIPIEIDPRIVIGNLGINVSILFSHRYLT